MKTETIKRLGITSWVFSLIMMASGLVLEIVSNQLNSIYSNIYAIFILIISILYFPLTFLLLSRSPRNIIAWLFLLVVFFLSAQTLGGSISAISVFPYSFTRLITQLAGNFWVPAFMTPITLMLLFFPDGQLPTRRWRPILYIAILGILFTYLGFSLENFWPDIVNSVWADLINFGLSLTLLIGILGSLMSVVFRFRKSEGLVRTQMKWLVYVAVLSISLLLLFLGAGLEETPIFEVIFFSPPVFVALAIGFAIQRYRLYDIDLIIRRTLSYSILTAVLALVYFGGIVLLQNVFVGLFGSGESPLITVISTLAIAALFNPLRSRIQEFIDLRFFRSKFDAEKALVDFAAIARDEVDMFRLSGSLLSVIESTMQPEQTSLWLRETTRGE